MFCGLGKISMDEKEVKIKEQCAAQPAVGFAGVDRKESSKDELHSASGR